MKKASLLGFSPTSQAKHLARAPSNGIGDHEVTLPSDGVGYNAPKK
jgi:hypothetical protein